MLLLALNVACEKDENGDKNDGDGFDRKAMLENMGNNIILPDYKAMNEEATALHDAAETFTNSPNNANLNALQDQFKSAYMAWQQVSTYEFGPAERVALRFNMNTFPVNDNIEEAIRNEETDWGPYDTAYKGFPVVDYMLFNHADNDQQIIDSFNQSNYATQRRNYLTAVTQDIRDMINTVYEDWRPSGNDYLNEFVNATGNDAGSSLSNLVNEISYDWEMYLRNAKVGIPAGERSLGGGTFPEKTEAYYSEISLALAKEQLSSIEKLFLGRYDGNNELGLDDHLDAVNAKYSNQDLSEAIKAQFEKASTKLDAIPEPLHESVDQSQSQVSEAYDALQRQVVFFKNDVPSALGVRITYQDNDGD